MNARADAIEQNSRYVSGTFGVEGSGSQEDCCLPFQAKIIGVSFNLATAESQSSVLLNPPTRPTYQWQLISETDQQGFFPGSTDNPYFSGGLQNQILNYPAYERTNNPNVPVDGSAIVNVYMGLAGAYVVFDFPREFVIARLTGDQDSIGGVLFKSNGYSWYELQPGTGATSIWKQFPPKNGGLQGGINTQINITGTIGVGGALLNLFTAGGFIDSGTSIANGGTNYPPNSTFNLRIAGGGGADGEIEVSTGAGGIITSINRIVNAGSGYSDTDDCAVAGPFNVISMTNGGQANADIINQLFIGQLIFSTTDVNLIFARTVIIDLILTTENGFIFLSRGAKQTSVGDTFAVGGNTGNAFPLKGEAITSFDKNTNFKISRGFCSGYPNITVTNLQDGNGVVPQKQSIVITNAYSGNWSLIFDSNSSGGSAQTTVPLLFNCAAADVELALKGASLDTTVATGISVTGSGNVAGVGNAADPFIVTIAGGVNYPPLIPLYQGILGNNQQWMFESDCCDSGLNIVWGIPGPQYLYNNIPTIDVPIYLYHLNNIKSSTDWGDAEFTVTDGPLDANPSHTATITSVNPPIGQILEGNGTGSVRMRSEQGDYVIAVSSIRDKQWLWGDQSRNSQEFLKVRDDVLLLVYNQTKDIVENYPLYGYISSSVTVVGSDGSSYGPGAGSIKAKATVIPGGIPSGGGGCGGVGFNLCINFFGFPASDPGKPGYNLGNLNGSFTLILSPGAGWFIPQICGWKSAHIDLGAGYAVISLSYFVAPLSGTVRWYFYIGITPYGSPENQIAPDSIQGGTQITGYGGGTFVLPSAILGSFTNIGLKLISTQNTFDISGHLDQTSCADVETIPIITSISPPSGPFAGGTPITITGSNFIGTVAVSFGTIPATSFVISSDTQIVAVTPAHAVGIVDITISNMIGISGTSSVDQFTYYSTSYPTVTAVTPIQGSITGGLTVVITGSVFTGTTSVLFGATAATSFVVDNDTQITAVIPAHAAGTIHVTVTNPNGTSTTSSADQFTYLQGPVVTSIVPSIGPTSGGTVVTITGSNFTGATSVTFDGTLSNFTFISDTEITTVSPAKSAGIVDIQVTTGTGTSPESLADQFSYGTQATITLVSPNTGPIVGGTSVTITGTGFTGTTVVSFGSFSTNNFTVVSDTQITAVSPAQSSGTVDITVANIRKGLSTVSIISVEDQFTYIDVPVIYSLTTTSGPIAGGQIVTIYGVNFTGATNVNFEATSATFSVTSDSVISTTAPAHAAGIVDVTIITPYGTSAIVAVDKYTYSNAPTVTSVTPSVGIQSGGTTVVIAGTGFSSVSSIKFTYSDLSYVQPVSYIVDSTIQITAVTAAGTPGLTDVTVTTPGGISVVSSADEFTYQPVILRTGTITGLASVIGYQPALPVNVPGSIIGSAAVVAVRNKLTLVSASSQYVDFGNLAAWQISKPLTLSCFFSATNVTPSQTLLSRYSDQGSQGGYMMSIGGGKLFFQFWNNGITQGSNTSTAAGSIVAGTLYHACATIDSSGNVIVYINAVSSATGIANTTAGNPTGASLIASGFYTGGFSSPGNLGNFLGGTLDAIRIYNIKLSAAQVTEIYGGGNGLVTAGSASANLIGWWGFDEASGNALDLTGNSRAGILTNGPTRSSALILG